MGLLHSCEAVNGITSLKKGLSNLNKNNDKMFKYIYISRRNCDIGNVCLLYI